MAIRRAPRPTSHYTTLANDLLRDDRLSYRARGILAAILSNADDWATSSEELARKGPEGRDAIRTALAELEAAGYLRRERRQDDRGRWATVAVVYDEPQDAKAQVTPTPGKPTPGKPTPGEPTPDNQASLEGPPKKVPPTEGTPTAPAADKAPPDQVATTIYEHAKGMVRYVAVRQIAVRALTLEGGTVEAVAAAMVRIYDAGRPITLQTVGQALLTRTVRDVPTWQAGQSWDQTAEG